MATRKSAAVKSSKSPKATAAPPATAASPSIDTSPSSSLVKGEADLLKVHPARTFSASETSAKLQALVATKHGYIVQDSLHLDGQAYQAGDPITLTDDQAAGLPAGIVLATEE